MYCGRYAINLRRSVQNLKANGFSLVELLVVLLVVAVLGAMALPRYDMFVERERQRNIFNDFVGAFELARMEAIKRGEDITVCVANATFTACDDTDDWSNGWLVRDANDVTLKVGQVTREAGDSVVELTAATEDGVVVFDSNGFASDTRTLRFCGPNPEESFIRGLTVFPVGLVYSAQDTNSDGVLEDHLGNDLACGEDT